MTRGRLLLLVALLVGLALAGPAGAHSQVREATPGPAETVTAPLDSVVLEFLDPVLPTPTIEVTGPGGGAVAGPGEVQLEGDDVARVDFDAVDEPGQYRVDYSFVALDGDEQTSAYTFTLVSVGQTRPVLPITLDTVRLFLHVLAATVWVGGQLTLAGLVPGLRALGPDVPRTVARRFNRIAWPAYGVLLVTGIWNLAESAFDARGTEWQVTLFVKLVVVALSGASATTHALTTSRTVLALGGAVAGLSSLAALFLGVQLTFG